MKVFVFKSEQTDAGLADPVCTVEQKSARRWQEVHAAALEDHSCFKTE